MAATLSLKCSRMLGLTHLLGLAGRPVIVDVFVHMILRYCLTLDACNPIQSYSVLVLKQVHPDKHPDFSAEATAATAGVNQAMDVRSRLVTEV